MSTPCANDPRFISDDVVQQRKAAALCFGCPAFETCEQLGWGERTGVYAGRIPSDPERKEFRARTSRDGSVCRNGHPVEEFGTLIGHLVTESSPLTGCTVCAGNGRELVAKTA